MMCSFFYLCNIFFTRNVVPIKKKDTFLLKFGSSWCIIDLLNSFNNNWEKSEEKRTNLRPLRFNYLTFFQSFLLDILDRILRVSSFLKKFFV